METLDKENVAHATVNTAKWDAALTVEEVAERLKVSQATVYSLLRAGTLVSYRVGRAWRVDEVDLHSFIQKQKARPTQNK